MDCDCDTVPDGKPDGERAENGIMLYQEKGT